MARFLVIDDDPTLRHLMVVTLQGGGHAVVEAPTGVAGLQMFEAAPTDVVVTDIVMPTECIEAVMLLRQRNPRLPFLVVSGLDVRSPQGGTVLRMLSPCRSLPKPFRLRDFLAAANAMIEGPQSVP
jgi:CheY-like chemotaxis protein